MSSRWTLATVGFVVLTTAGLCRHFIVHERARHAKRERKEALATWEGEGGAIATPVTPAEARFTATAA